MLDAIVHYLSQPVHIIEAIATITGLICVYLNARGNIWGWPVGILSVGLAVFVYYQSFLYSDFILHIIYVILGFYGWYQWAYGGQSHSQLPITRLGTSMWVLSIATGVAGLFILGWVFDTYTNASFAYWDAYTTSFSLVAQFLLAKKKLGNWLVWIAVDLIAIGIYFAKELYFFTFLYVGYLILAIYGYLEWKKIEQRQAGDVSTPIID
jgi:nicotinamide mononucleotide transporter